MSRSGAKCRYPRLTRVGAGLEKYVCFSYPPRHGPILIPGLGIARSRPELTVIVLDGNGSILMNLGSLTTMVRYRPPNLIHVVFDNEVLRSVGQSFTMATATGSDIAAMAAAAGVPRTVKVDAVEAFREAFDTALQAQALTMLVAKIEPQGPASYVIDVHMLENRFEFQRCLKQMSLGTHHTVNAAGDSRWM